MIGELPRGPRPGRSMGLSSARARVLRAVDDLSADEPASLARLAAHLGGHPNTTRQHLTGLVRDGLLAVETFDSGRPGRRPQAFTLTARGRTALQGTSESGEYHQIVGAFASYLIREGDAPRRAREVGDLWASREAAAPPATRESLVVDEPTAMNQPAAMDQLVEMLDILGFEPARAATTQGRPAVVLKACPLLDLAHEHPEVICELHRGMVDGVMRRLGAAEGVELLPMADPQGCVIQQGGDMS